MNDTYSDFPEGGRLDGTAPERRDILNLLEDQGRPLQRREIVERLGVTSDISREILRRRLELPADARVGLGVDRLDYTKGIEERMLSVECLLEKHPEHRGRFTFVQIAAPSRTALDTYQHLNDQVEAVAVRINARFGREGYRPIVLLREHHDPPAIYRAYRGADLCYVSSLHDGMNLVAKEYVVAQDESDPGVLILSRFAGAAESMGRALIVNPYDVEQVAYALQMAIHMPLEERRERHQALLATIKKEDVHAWSRAFLTRLQEARPGFGGTLPLDRSNEPSRPARKKAPPKAS